MLVATSIEIMHKMFREQHRQMINEQKQLLDDYKQYFDGILQQMDAHDKKAEIQKAQESKEDMQKEIATLGSLLNEAVQTYGKEIADIIEKLTERQKRRNATEAEEKEKIS